VEAAASGIAGVVASILLLWSLNGVVLVQAFTGFMPLLLGLSLVEVPRPATKVNHRENARHIVELLLFGKPVILWTAFAIAVFGTRKLLCLVAALPLFGLIGMAFGAGWLGVMFGFAIQASRGVSMSLFYEALNRRVPGEFRATVNSLVSLGVRAIFIVTGPVLGFALDSQGMSSTLLALVAIFTPLMGLVLVPLVIRIRRESGNREIESGLEA
jgi:hypothetical protein